MHCSHASVPVVERDHLVEGTLSSQKPRGQKDYQRLLVPGRRNEARVACSSADCMSGSGRRNRRNDSVKLVGLNPAPSPSSSEDDGDFDLVALVRFEGMRTIEKDVDGTEHER